MVEDQRQLAIDDFSVQFIVSPKIRDIKYAMDVDLLLFFVVLLEVLAKIDFLSTVMTSFLFY